MFVVIRHYTNENIGEFDKLTVFNEEFDSLENACEFAQKMADEERKFDDRKVIKAPIGALDYYFEQPPLAVCGYEDEDGEVCVYHDLYGIWQIGGVKEKTEQNNAIQYQLIGTYERESVVECISPDLEYVRNEMLRLMANAANHSEDYILEECVDDMNDEANYSKWSAWANNAGWIHGNCDWFIVPLLYKADGTVKVLSPADILKRETE